MNQLDQQGPVRITKFNPETKKALSIPTIVVNPPDAEDPSLLTKAQRLRRELAAWGKAGFRLATTEVRKERGATCDACPYYDPKGNWGMGQCKAPGCGCTRIKLALEGSKCPKGKWKR